MGQLRVICDLLEGSFDLSDGPTSVGRTQDNEIQLSHKSVSRHHAVVTEEGGRLHVKDYGSTYGTFINDETITDGYAETGDTVRFGRIDLKFDATEEDSPISAEPAESRVSEPATPPPPQESEVEEFEPPPEDVATSVEPELVARSTEVPVNPAPASTPPRTVTASNQPRSKFELKPLDPVQTRSKPAKKVHEYVKPVLASKVQREAEEAAASDTEPVEEKPKAKVVGGAFSRLSGDRKRPTKATRQDYTSEAEKWEEAAEEQEEGGSNYAAEAKDWEKVWGKQRAVKGMWGSGSGLLGGILGTFAQFGGKSRMMIVIIFFALGGGVMYPVYQKATAHVLVPKNRTALAKAGTAKSGGDGLSIKEIVSQTKDAGDGNLIKGIIEKGKKAMAPKLPDE